MIDMRVRTQKIILVLMFALQTFASYLFTETRGLLVDSYLVEGEILYSTETTTGSEDNEVFLLAGFVTSLLVIWFSFRWRTKLRVTDVVVFVAGELLVLFLILNIIEVGSIADTVRIDRNVPLIGWLALQGVILVFFVASVMMQIIRGQRFTR